MASKGEQRFWVCLIIITPNASLMADVVIILFHHHIRQALSAKRDIKEQDIFFYDAHGRLETGRCLEYCFP